MNVFFAWAVLFILTVIIIAAVIAIVRQPMRRMLNTNSFLTATAPFYTRTFIVVISLAALASIAGAYKPSSEPTAAKHFMEWVWWVVNSLTPVLWSVGLFLMAYVLLITILYAVLGRYHD